LASAAKVGVELKDAQGKSVGSALMYAQAYIVLKQDGSVEASSGLRKAQCDLYRDVLKQRMSAPH